MHHPHHLLTASTYFLRIALAAGFLSAVADRFGLWGPPGAPGVAWGDWKSFLGYTATLNWFVPQSFIALLGWIATVAEVVLALALLIGWRLRITAALSGLLLLTFALSMTFAIGPKPPLDYSVFTAAAAAFVLAALTPAAPDALPSRKHCIPPAAPLAEPADVEWSAGTARRK